MIPALLTLAWALAPIPPGEAIAPPIADAAPTDGVVLGALPGPRALADCPGAAWDHHPLDPTGGGRWCAAWIRVGDEAPVLAVGRPGHPPMALRPTVYRMTYTDDSLSVSERPPPADPAFAAALIDALDAWAAAPAVAR